MPFLLFVLLLVVVGGSVARLVLPFVWMPALALAAAQQAGYWFGRRNAGRMPCSVLLATSVVLTGVACLYPPYSLGGQFSLVPEDALVIARVFQVSMFLAPFIVFASFRAGKDRYKFMLWRDTPEGQAWVRKEAHERVRRARRCGLPDDEYGNPYYNGRLPN